MDTERSRPVSPPRTPAHTGHRFSAIAFASAAAAVAAGASGGWYAALAGAAIAAAATSAVCKDRPTYTLEHPQEEQHQQQTGEAEQLEARAEAQAQAQAQAPAHAPTEPQPEDREGIPDDYHRFPLEKRLPALLDGREHLIFTTLSGNGAIEDYRMYESPDRMSMYARLRAGHKVTGHPQIIHGGASAAMLDNLFGFLFFNANPGQTGFTANLNVQYRAPWAENHDALFFGKVDRIEGRKVFLSGEIKDLESNTVLVEATALFILTCAAPPLPTGVTAAHGEPTATVTATASSPPTTPASAATGSAEPTPTDVHA